MTTWPDWFVRQRAELTTGADLEADVRPARRTPGAAAGAISLFTEEVRARARPGAPRTDPSMHLLSVCLEPFLRGFLAPHRRDPDPGPALGLVLTRETASLLADADPPPTDPWHRRVFGEPLTGDGVGAVYVDVPHGSLLLNRHTQLRAVFATPWSEQSEPGAGGTTREETILVGMVVTAAGSERRLGMAFAAAKADKVLAVASPDGRLTGFLRPETLDPGSTEEDRGELHASVVFRSVGFLRLALAFHRYGPAEARAAIKATPADVAAENRNRPKKGESLFAMVRLSAPEGNLGRPRRGAPAGWSLAARQEVSRRFRLQPHGPGGSLRRLIWIDMRAMELAFGKRRRSNLCSAPSMSSATGCHARGFDAVLGPAATGQRPRSRSAPLWRSGLRCRLRRRRLTAARFGEAAPSEAPIFRAACTAAIAASSRARLRCDRIRTQIFVGAAVDTRWLTGRHGTRR